MSFIRPVIFLLHKIFYPIRTNSLFFVFMYTLGILCEWLTLPHIHRAHVYDNLYLELFLDLYIACLFLAVLPSKIRLWVRRLFYVVMYAITLADVYCYAKFNSTFTPTMLLLIGETDGREAVDFFQSYLSSDIVFGKVGWIWLLITIHLLVVLRHRIFNRKKIFGGLPHHLSPNTENVFGMLVSILLVWSSIASFQNKRAIGRLFSASSIGNVEHALTAPDRAVLYTPSLRLTFSLFANSLTAQQLDKLIEQTDKATIDSCSFTSPNIVLIIGESYGKHHAQLYGYDLPTTPRQIKRQQSGRLVKYTDAVAPWNLTSFVFKLAFSTFTVSDQDEWCDYPLFPELFRKAGYHVTFLTNQFLPKAADPIYDFSGGFFLNNPALSKALFDTRNSRLHAYDVGLIGDYENMLKANLLPMKNGRLDRNLIIFHLLGQHMNYRSRYPKGRGVFKKKDYNDRRPDLNDRQKRILSEYDNAVLYNDSIVDQICRRFENEEAIVIYMPDHGEECYEGNRNFICRNHSSNIDYNLAHYEFEIPFWIWCSHPYAIRHPEIYKQIVESRDRPFMTDALPHLLLYLGGIGSPHYHERYNILSPQYDEKRPRILKNTTNYDSLRNSQNLQK